MFKKAILGLSLFLVSCDQGPKQGADGYRFGQKQYTMQEVQISIVTYQSQKELQRALGNRGGVQSENVIAFSVLKPPFDTCTIHMVDPAVSYQPEYVGHEFLHCVYGQWHKDNNTH